MSLIKHKVETKNGKKVHHLKWLNEPIPKDTFDEISKYFWSLRKYSGLDKKIVKKNLKIINEKRPNSYVEFDQAASIYHLLMKEKVMKRKQRIIDKISEIAARYKNESILKLSYEYDFPPLILLYNIFLHLGYGTAKASALIRGKNLENASQYDRKMITLAATNDYITNDDQPKIAKIAQKNEDICVAFFRSLDIGLKTQEQLGVAQMIIHGRQVITPDILFTEDVYINGQHVAWIDFKSYVGAPIDFIYKSNCKQAAKYNEKWGPGAICYQLGYVDGLTIPNTAIIDGLSIDADFDDDLY